ncbi:MAG: YjbQ family protein, partial [Candidatus Heimdallarchaeota archaeon]|nr:YjbQ family protein [Candidatus Heimdallarchaeota archaeon]
MTTISEVFTVQTAHENHIIDLTPQIQDTVSRMKMENGLLTVFVAGSTAAITTIEYEVGLI